jgi:hypothetical protein
MIEQNITMIYINLVGDCTNSDVDATLPGRHGGNGESLGIIHENRMLYPNSYMLQNSQRTGNQKSHKA